MSWRSLGAALFFSAVGCGSAQAPQLIDLDSIAPLEVEIGSQLTLIGGGFPAGRSAHVRFVGSIYRPGMKAESNVEVEAEGIAPENYRLNVTIDERLAERFCGVGPDSVHATFRGSVVAAFSPLVPGTSPVTAALGNVTLDVQPPGLSAARTRERIVSAKQLLAYWGIEGEPTTMGSGGVEIKALRAGSPAARVLNTDDVLIAIDGVRIASVSDVATQGDVAKVVVRRGNDELERELPAKEFEQRPFRRHGAALACLAALLLATLAFASFNARGRAKGAKRSGGSLGGPVLALSMCALAIVPLLDNAWSVHTDVTSVLGWLLALCAATAYVERGTSRMGSFFRTVLAVTPVAIAVVATSVTTGAWRLEELVRSQASGPVDWFAFRGPAMTALFGCASLGLSRARLPLAVRVHLAAMLVLAFGGGWLSPFGGSAQHPSTELLVIGIVTFMAKSTALTWATTLPIPAVSRLGDRLHGTAYALLALALCPLTWHAEAPLFVRTFLASASVLMVGAVWLARKLPQRTTRVNALL